MHIGLALPPFDPASTGDDPGPWARVLEAARQAESLGFGSVWLGDDGYDPLVVLGALARATSRVRLGVLLSTSRRPPTVLAKALATIDVVSDGRLIVGLSGAEGSRLAEVCQVLVGMFGGGPFTLAGAHFQVTGARCLPVPVQGPHPPIWVSGRRGGLLDVVARHADGWIATSVGNPDAYRRDLAGLEAACDRVGRDPATVTRSIVLSPPAGTAQAVGRQLDAWEALGVASVVVGAGGLSPTGPDDVALLAAACSLEPVWASDPPNS